jgi:6-phosphogluconolactonase
LLLLFTANYFSGELTVLRTAADGALLPGVTTPLPGPSTATYPGPIEIRQDGPHAHCFYPDPGTTHAFAADLGSDEVVVVSVDAITGAIAVTDRMATPPGTGPRHVALSPGKERHSLITTFPLYIDVLPRQARDRTQNKMAFRIDRRHLYVSGELSSTLSSCSYDGATGTLKLLETRSVLPDSFIPPAAGTTVAHVELSPCGKWAYVGNRVGVGVDGACAGAWKALLC